MFKVTTTFGPDVKYRTLKFSGGEIQVHIEQFETEYEPVFIHANLSDSDKIMELVMLVDALRRINPLVHLHLVCPYLPYARQDRVCDSGEALAVKVMADIINSLNFEQVEIWDCHSDVGIAVINRVKNRAAETFLTSILKNHPEYVLISPDAGAMKKVGKVAKTFNLPMVVAGKIRNPQNGAITGTYVNATDFNGIGNAKLLIVDDICDGGRTFIELAKVLKQIAPNNEIELYVTHGIFSKGLDVILESGISKIYTANPFPNVDLTNTKLTVVR